MNHRTTSKVTLDSLDNNKKPQAAAALIQHLSVGFDKRRFYDYMDDTDFTPRKKDTSNSSLLNASSDSAVPSDCSPFVVNPRRRASKSRAEKRRRDRINTCFRRLQQQLEDIGLPSSVSTAGTSTECDLSNIGTPQSPQLEKAELLEKVSTCLDSLRHKYQQLQTKHAEQPDVPSIYSKGYLDGYKKGIQNIFILIDKLCGNGERLTKYELVSKIKTCFLDRCSDGDVLSTISDHNFTSNRRVSCPPQAAPSTNSPRKRAVFGDVSNKPLTPKKRFHISNELYQSSPVRPPAKKRKAFRDQLSVSCHLDTTQFEPISPDPFPHLVDPEDSLWRPWGL